MTAAMRTTLITLALARAWQPQLPQTGNWTGMIEEELERSLRAYERPTNNDAAYALAEQLLQDPDRFVLILGDTLIERMQEFNHLELRLTTAFRKRNIIFRNIGWSGDTPRGVSRAGLSLLQAGREPEGEGLKQLQKQIELVSFLIYYYKLYPLFYL